MSESQPSASSPRQRMSLVSEVEIPDLPQASPTIATNEVASSPELLSRAAWKAGVLGSLNFAAQVLAVRMILIVGVSGAIALAWLGLTQPDVLRLAVLATYCVTVVLPLVWLSSRR